MVTSAILRILVSPLRITGYNLPGVLVVAARCMGLVLILRQEWPFERHIPFFETLDNLGDAKTFNGTVLATFWVGLSLIFVTPWVRLGSILTGASFLLGLIACRPCQSAAHTYVACFFLIIGMSSKVSGPGLLHAQLILLYLGAGIHKAVDPDWWNGKYFETLLFSRHEMPGFEEVAARFPPMLFSRLMGAGTVLIEFLIPALLLLPRTRTIGVLTALLFHSAMVLMMRQSFGPFFAALLLTFLTFLPWPDAIEIVAVPRYHRLAGWISWLNHDRFSRIDVGETMLVGIGNERQIRGTAASLIYLVARTPVFLYLISAWLALGPWRGKLIVAIVSLALAAWLSTVFSSRRARRDGKIGKAEALTGTTSS